MRMKQTAPISSGLTVLRSLSVMLFFVVLAVAPIPTMAQSKSITVAVMPLEFRGGSQWSTIDVGEQITALITNQLVEMGRFQVLERAYIDKILAEQKLGTSGLVDPSRAPEIGKLLGADALVFGTVTQFEFSSSAGISFGAFSLSGTTAKVSLTGRVVDTTQGLILGSLEGSGQNTGASLSVQNFHGVSFHSAQFQETSVGKATYAAVGDFVKHLADALDRSGERLQEARALGSLKGAVVALIDNGVVLNIGEQHGVRREQRYELARLLLIPGLTEAVRIPVGVIRIISVDRQASVALIESMTQPVQVGDVASLQ